MPNETLAHRHGGVRRALHRGLLGLESVFDAIKLRWDRRVHGKGPFVLVPYRGFGNDRQVWQCGRVLRLPAASSTRTGDSIWHRLLRMFRRFETDEVPGAVVEASGVGAVARVETDDEGYFTVELDRFSLGSESWQTVDYRLVRPGSVAPVRARGRVRVPGACARRLIISDIDDTIVETNAFRRLHMLRTVLFAEAAERVPFVGAAAFYRALAQDVTTAQPIFYLSSSPWNLYDLLEEYLALQSFPEGPLLLRDYGLDADKVIHSSHESHKLAWIERLLDTYPEFEVVLIGDSGQRDPEIYAQVVRNYPERIAAVYLRDAEADRERRHSLDVLSRQAADRGVDFLHVADTLAAARHARDRGWITTRDLDQIASCGATPIASRRATS